SVPADPLNPPARATGAVLEGDSTGGEGKLCAGRHQGMLPGAHGIRHRGAYRPFGSGGARRFSSCIATPTTCPMISASLPILTSRVFTGDNGCDLRVRMEPMTSHQQQVNSSRISTR